MIRPGVAAVFCCTLAVLCAGGGPESQPADSALWKKLTEIDARAARIQSLSANFQQQKFTPILAQPLVSSGLVKIRGAVIRWNTITPEKSVLFINPQEAKIYYPAQKTLEIYPLDQRLGELAASPLPRMDVLKTRFSFEQIPVKELLEDGDPGRFLALSLSPSDPTLRQHLQQVRVLLDVAGSYIVKAEVTDADGDRTVLSFSNTQLNVDVGDLSLTVPPGTRVSHPLEGLNGSPVSQGKSQ